MEDLLWGWCVVIAALAFGVVIAWWGFKFDNVLPVSEGGGGEDTVAFDIDDTQVIHLREPVIVDVRPVVPTVVDELGEWAPWDHDLEEPVLLGEVLAGSVWESLTPRAVGLVAA